MCVCVCVQAAHVVEKRKGRLELGRLAVDVQALRDVKHFVKDYKGHLPLALPSPGTLSLAQSSTPCACIPALHQFTPVYTSPFQHGTLIS